MSVTKNLKRLHPNPQDIIPHFFLTHTGSIVFLCYRFGWNHRCKQNSRDNFDIKVKIDVDHYSTKVAKSRNHLGVFKICLTILRRCEVKG